ncbi:Alpha/beta hydrolase psoB [Metarhizium anisopliae]
MVTMHTFFKSAFFNFEYLRLLAMAPHEGAEIGEALEAAAKIRDLDPESWFNAFLEAGNKAECIAKEAEQAGDVVSARRAYLRSSNYLLVTFEGPGQGIVLRRDKLPMRPDWEVVTGAVLNHLFDFAASHPDLELDLDNIAVTGASMGGYFALRAAVDPRIKACVSVDGFYSLASFVGGRMPGPLFNGFMKGWLSDRTFNAILGFLQRLDFQARWEFNHLKWATNSTTEAEIMRSFGDYTLLKPDGTEYLADVKCPTLVTGAGASWYFDPATTTDKIYDCLTSLKDGVDKEKWIANDIAYGGLQAKIGAFGYSAQRTFQWLDMKFGIRRETLNATSDLGSLVKNTAKNTSLL